MDLVIGLSKLFDQHGIENWIIDHKWVLGVDHVADKESRRGPLAGLLNSDNLFICFYNTGFPRRMIFYNSEPLRFRDAKDFAGLSNLEGIWDYSLDNEAVIKSLKSESEDYFRYMPFGYLPYYEECYQRRLREKSSFKLSESEIDVLYYGIMNDRRKGILRNLGGSGMFKVYCATPGVERSEQFISNLERDQLISRAKIVLSINKRSDSAPTNDLFRLSYLISNRIFVVVERNDDPITADLEAMGIVHGNADHLPEICTYYLTHPEERARKVEQAYQEFKKKYSYDNWLPWKNLKQLK